MSLSVFADPARHAEIESLAHLIAGDGVLPEILELARRIAEAQIDLQRVRQARLAHLARDLSNPEYRPDKFLTDSNKMIKAIAGLLRSDFTNQLMAIDRYERRALSRRKFAIRALDAMRRQSAALSRGKEAKNLDRLEIRCETRDYSINGQRISVFSASHDLIRD